MESPKVALGHHPIDRAARKLFLLTAPSQSDSVLLEWLLAETDPELFGILWDRVSERAIAPMC
jgi:hypothetical protein